MNLVEAFKALNALNEDTFTISDDGINKLSQFEQSDDLTDEISVIDPEAETEDDFQDSYVGKVILDCVVCHSKLYKDKEEVEIDEEEQLANVGEECPYCYTSDGFKIIGEVSAFETSKEDEEDDEKDDEEPEVKSDEDEKDDDKEITESYKGTISQMKTINEGIFGLGKKKKPDFYSKEEIAKRKKDRADKLQKDREEREEQERQRGAEIAKGWKERDDRKKQAEKDYNRSRYNNIKGSNVSNTGKSGVHYSGGDYYTESIEDDENLVESPVATLDRPMSKMAGTLGNVLTAHKDELFFMNNKQDTIDWLNKLEPEIKNKEYLSNVIKDIEKLPDFKVQSYLYNIILKGDGMGSGPKSIKKESKSNDKNLVKRLKALATEYDIDEDLLVRDPDGKLTTTSDSSWGTCKEWNYNESINESKDIDNWEIEYNDGAIQRCPQPNGTINIKGDWNDVLDKLEEIYADIPFEDDGETCTIDKFVNEYEDIADFSGSTAILRIIKNGKVIFKISEYEEYWSELDAEYGFDESINESVNTVNVETDDSIVTVDTQEDGKVTVSTEAKKEESNEEVITPISDETKTDIEDNVEEPIDSEETIDVELDEFDEESFDQLGESYLKEIYENVNKYKTSQVSIKKDKLVVEGVIDFTSGAKKKTSFIFESKDCTKQGKLRFTGRNKHITEDVTPFTLQGRIIKNKFISESFKYNYKALNESTDSAKIRGCIIL